LRGEVIAALRQPPAGQLERWVFAQIVQIVGIGIPAADGEDAGAQDVRHGVGNQGWIAMIRNERSQHIDQAKAFVGTRQQQDAAVGTDLTGIKGGSDLLLADTWQSER
jgi:hypothetical protein